MDERRTLGKSVVPGPTLSAEPVPARPRRRLGTVLAPVLLGVLLVTGLAACSGERRSDTDVERLVAGTGAGGRSCSVLAEADADGFRLHTASGDKTFLPGINLGSSVPDPPARRARQPRPPSDYRRWFGEMADLGIRVIRIYTLHPPAFYDELAAWNRAHPDAPFYLVQGVYLPDETYIEAGRTLYTPAVDDAFAAELARRLGRRPRRPHPRRRGPGRASAPGTRTCRRGCVSWIVGVEWDPAGTARTDALAAGAAPYRPGRYFAATADATNTERWLARHLDDAGRGRARAGGQRADRVRQLAHHRPARAPRGAAGPRRTSSASTPSTCCPPTPGRAARSRASTPTRTTPTSSATSPALQVETGRPGRPVRRVPAGAAGPLRLACRC